MKWGVPEWIASVFGIGKLPLAPGTWGSLAAIIAWYFIGPYFNLFSFCVFVIAVSLVGISTSDKAAKNQNDDDPSFVVIDEWTGQWVAVIGLPVTPEYAAGAFILFRIFDILKPGPIKSLEKRGGGFGIMADDLAAGGLTLLILHSVRYFTL
jgi:phosphatidylglycerophosphatase A